MITNKLPTVICKQDYRKIDQYVPFSSNDLITLAEVIRF